MSSTKFLSDTIYVIVNKAVSGRLKKLQRQNNGPEKAATAGVTDAMRF